MPEKEFINQNTNAVPNISNGTRKSKEKKKKRRDKSDLGPDFVAPDGGWGWVVCIAAGLSNFSLFPPLQQYGFIYRDRMQKFGFDAKEITTIFNVEMALSSIVGLVNGAMFRRFTFRQVGAFGGLMAFVGVLLSAFCDTFVQYLICYSAIYGIGLGLCMSSTSLAVNTYFKTKRRKATGFSWTLTGLGPIIFPHISLLLMAHYGSQGSILVYAAIVLNSFLCALTLQPVLWHSPKRPSAVNQPLSKTTHIDIEPNYKCKYCQYQSIRKRSIFSSQYIFNEDDPEKPGFEITEPGTPMMARANDGWYGSKLSLAEKNAVRYKNQRYRRRISKQVSFENTKETLANEENSLFKPNYFNRERDELDRYASKTSVYSKSAAGGEYQCTCIEEKLLMQTPFQDGKSAEMGNEDSLADGRVSLWQKVVVFFDLDLLKDFTFVNLAAGVSIMTFGEINFSILTPFILNSFGYSDTQISRAMSLLAVVDISVRFLGPFVLEKVKLPNQVLFGFGIVTISTGRLIVAITDSYLIVVLAFALIGFGKGFRTIFSPLIIPSYVPLKRLPAASGLQLIFHTITYFLLGPLLGLMTDNFGYGYTIHGINSLSCFALVVWVFEFMLRRRHQKSSK